ncbi:MAG: Methyltransferase [Candidatus Uhrbacteria bacterium GW2011_GWF2_41_430]|nr:MAG: Methyltransferase [Candidatus Uhrbacteria bacterium GW2011_GWF2_41_430]
MKDTKDIVRKGYAAIAKTGGCCCKSKKIAQQIGYSQGDTDELSDANLGLGCGNPTAIGEIKEGDVVLDLGCGAGFDAFLAQRKVGSEGKVIGVDMTEEMITKAKQNAGKLDVKNVEFVLGDIEDLPINDETIDIIISNCVINLAPDKDEVFQEAYRVLKTGGALYLSDIVLLGELTPEQKQNPELLTGCVAGALPKDVYLDKLKKAGFSVEVKKENKEISKQQYAGINLESISIKAKKE